MCTPAHGARLFATLVAFRALSQSRPMSARKPSFAAEAATPEASLVEADLYQVVGYQLAQASIVTGRLFAEGVGKSFELRPVEFTVLKLIADNPDVSARQLSRALAVTPPNITMWVDRLVERGLVTRERSATDGRAQHLRTTEAGAVLAQAACQAVITSERAVLATALSAAEQAMLVELLHKLACCRPSSGA